MPYATVYLEAFSSYLAGECHLAENTVKAYRRDLVRFLRWLGKRRPAQLTLQDISAYPAWLLETEQLAPSSVARHLISLKMFFRYLQLEGELRESAVELLGSPKLWERVPHVLSPELIERLLETPHRYDPCPLRDRALLELLYATGCRASEVSHLKLADVRLDEGFCACHGKGDKERIVPLGRRAAESVRQYLEHERPQLAAPGVARSRPPCPGYCSRVAASGCGGSGFGSCSRCTPVGRVRRRTSVRTRCGTASPRTSWRAGPICGRCKRCSATPASPRHSSTRTSIRRG